MAEVWHLPNMAEAQVVWSGAITLGLHTSCTTRSMLLRRSKPASSRAPCECAASVFLPVRAQRRPVWDKAGDDLEAAFAEIAEGAATCSS